MEVCAHHCYEKKGLSLLKGIFLCCQTFQNLPGGVRASKSECWSLAAQPLHPPVRIRQEHKSMHACEIFVCSKRPTKQSCSLPKHLVKRRYSFYNIFSVFIHSAHGVVLPDRGKLFVYLVDACTPIKIQIRCHCHFNHHW
jgi:hypothetical protein